MKTTSCKACGKEVSRQAKACPHCGHPAGDGFLHNATTGLMKTIGAAFLFIVFMCFLFSRAEKQLADNPLPDSTPPVVKQMPKEKVREICAKAERWGEAKLVLKWDSNGFYVDPVLWAASNVDIKNAFFEDMAACQIASTNAQSSYFKIYDYQSGKLLAEYSSYSDPKFY